MNYRHHYHAGNFADVMKHVLLIELLQRLGQKDKPFRYLDSHSGAGLYDLSRAPAQKTGEYLDGIHRLMQLSSTERRAAPPSVQTYLQQVQQLRDARGQGWYPGSPWLALQNLRPQDGATLVEFQPDVFAELRQNLRTLPQARSAQLHQRDAYEGLPALLPPAEKRGLVLIDPPYETERKDFPQLVELLQKLHQRWSSGVYALWYPIKDRALIDRFEKKMQKTGIRRQLVCELCPWPDDVPTGLNGCGLLVINPPFQFAAEADRILQWLYPHLRQPDQQGHASVRYLVGE